MSLALKMVILKSFSPKEKIFALKKTTLIITHLQVVRIDQPDKYPQVSYQQYVLLLITHTIYLRSVVVSCTIITDHLLPILFHRIRFTS